MSITCEATGSRETVALRVSNVLRVAASKISIVTVVSIVSDELFITVAGKITASPWRTKRGKLACTITGFAAVTSSLMVALRRSGV